MQRTITLALFSLAGCLEGSAERHPIPGADDRPGIQQPAEPGVEPEPVAITTDFCDDSQFTNATWLSYTSPHFTLNYLPGTPAETDRQVIAARLELAYADIRARLGVASEPVFSVNLS